MILHRGGSTWCVIIMQNETSTAWFMVIHHSESSFCRTVMHHADASKYIVMTHDAESSWCIITTSRHESAEWVAIIRHDGSIWFIMLNRDAKSWSPWWIIKTHHGDSRWLAKIRHDDSSFWITVWPFLPWTPCIHVCHTDIADTHGIAFSSRDPQNENCNSQRVLRKTANCTSLSYCTICWIGLLKRD